MSYYDDFIKHLEKISGLTINQIQDMSLDELRAYFEKKFGTKMKFTVNPQEELVTSEELNKDVDKILGIKFKKCPKNKQCVKKAPWDVADDGRPWCKKCDRPGKDKK
jgi:hypothetical protein